MAEIISVILGISFASGLNVYATVLGLGLLDRFGAVQLPGQLDVVSATPILIGAGVMYVIEFVADKIPYVDNMWDAIHAFIRPAAGALLAYSAVGDVDVQWQMLAVLAGGSVALASHTAKASTRAAANISPEPFSNWILSFTEDALALGLVWGALEYPLIALAVVIVFTIIAAIIIIKLSHLIRRAWRRSAV